MSRGTPIPVAPGEAQNSRLFTGIGADMQTRVFIADDHTLMREGLRSLLAVQANISVVGAAEVAERMVFSEDAPGGKPLHELLSARETQVLALLAAGKGIKEIARELELSPKTASTYKTRVMEKLKVESDAELFRYAITHQIAR